eukprot:5172790-Alexandrium_andersonii.AAC.1
MPGQTEHTPRQHGHGVLTCVRSRSRACASELLQLRVMISRARGVEQHHQAPPGQLAQHGPSFTERSGHQQEDRSGVSQRWV